MSYKENNDMGTTSSVPTPFVKPEPQETRLAPLAESTLRRNASDASDTLTNVKPEPKDTARVFQDRGLPVPSYVANTVPSNSGARNATAGAVVPKSEDVTMGDGTNDLPDAPKESKPRLYTIYDSANDVPYQPEDALKEGLGMVKTLKASIKKLELGSKLRQDVWLREIDSLQAQGAPTTMIAVCGATGAGKSSILNAILDDNVVPTSGMRACTAVVTEIAYHAKKTIDADISFLSEGEWKQELEVLLDDLVDEDGNIKRSTDMKSDAGVAWSKVHAVYPTISQEQLVGMTVDQIVAKDQKIAKILGTTKNIVAKDSKIFAQEIAKYIDSKDQKRGKKDKKDKSKPKENSFADMFSREKQAAAQQKDKDHKDDVPALWPLIRQVNVRCSSAALSSGAVLVDLPGVADANAARNSIAKDYMKKCDCIWIVASVHRAVDDKTARDLLGDAFKMQLMMDGNYDAHAITFIASKCDDISCSEVIRALQLEEDPELEEIEERIDQYKEETSEWKRKKTVAEKSAKAIDAQLKEVRAYLKEYKAHLDALKNGETFKPTLTGKSTNKESKKANGKKRKRSSKSCKKGSPKRRKSDAFEDEDEDMSGSNDEDMEDDIESDFGSDDVSDGDEDPNAEESDDDNASKSGSDSEGEGSDVENGGEDETEESLKTKIADANNAIKAGRERLSEARKEKKDAIDGLAGLKKKQTKAQKEKNAFCSLKRSEFSRDVLKEDFRVGLKDLDDAAAEERDPDSFNPNVNLRNYDEIDLPVFTCSARDYVRLKGQVEGDGEATCFSNLEDTSVPALQEWCHQLTISSRERAARNFLSHLKAFANSVRTYVQGIGDITAADRTLLREKWESSPQEDEDQMDPGYGGGWASSDPFDLPGFANLAGGLGDDLYSMNKVAPKVDPYGEPVGVTPLLTKEFKTVVDNSVRDLQKSFRDGLEDKCRLGAANAAEAAVPTTDAFAASMHWGTFRATLRRHGEFRRSLNVELVNPFTRNIASSWQQVFEGDLFTAFETATLKCINKLLKDVEDSAAFGLKDRVKSQAELCLEEAKVALKKTVELVRQTMNNEQKEVSRCLAPHVQDQLIEGYDRAMEERGTGSVARQKAVMHDYIDDCKDDVFDDGADVLLDRLAQAAEAIGAALDNALSELAEKIEVNLSVLWEGPRDHPDQVRARNETVEKVTEILGQVQLWTEAEQLRA